MMSSQARPGDTRLLKLYTVVNNVRVWEFTLEGNFLRIPASKEFVGDSRSRQFERKIGSEALPWPTQQ